MKVAVTLTPAEIREAVVDYLHRHGLDTLPEDVEMKVRVAIHGNSHAEGPLSALAITASFEAEHVTQGPYR